MSPKFCFHFEHLSEIRCISGVDKCVWIWLSYNTHPTLYAVHDYTYSLNVCFPFFFCCKQNVVLCWRIRCQNAWKTCIKLYHLLCFWGGRTQKRPQGGGSGVGGVAGSIRRCPQALAEACNRWWCHWCCFCCCCCCCVRVNSLTSFLMPRLLFRVALAL